MALAAATDPCQKHPLRSNGADRTAWQVMDYLIGCLNESRSYGKAPRGSVYNVNLPHVWPTIDEIAKAIRASRSTVQRALLRLAALGLIDRIPWFYSNGHRGADLISLSFVGRQKADVNLTTGQNDLMTTGQNDLADRKDRISNASLEQRDSKSASQIKKAEEAAQETEITRKLSRLYGRGLTPLECEEAVQWEQLPADCLANAIKSLNERMQRDDIPRLASPQAYIRTIIAGHAPDCRCGAPKDSQPRRRGRRPDQPPLFPRSGELSHIKPIVV